MGWLADATRGKIARNSLFNMVGQGAPIVASVVCIPILVEGLGLAKFGLLSLCWGFIGYFSVLDLGLGRATTFFGVRASREASTHGLNAIGGTSVAVLAGIGFLAAVIGVAASPWLAWDFLQVPDSLQREAAIAFAVAAISAPFVTVSSGLRGLLEAQGRFGVINAIRAPIGVLYFVAPVAALRFTDSLPVAVAAILFGRVALTFAFGIACSKTPTLAKRWSIERTLIKEMVSYGGWVSVAGIVGTVMLHIDKLVIGKILGVDSLAFYSAPYEMAVRLWIIPSAVAAVVFPMIGGAFADSDRNDARRFATRGVALILLSVVPICLMLILFAEPVLRLWLGQQFATNSVGVVRILAVGVVLGAVAYVPTAVIQAAGLTRVSGIAELILLPLYAPAIWMATARWGLMGAAVTWSAKQFISTLAFTSIAWQLTARSGAAQ